LARRGEGPQATLSIPYMLIKSMASKELEETEVSARVTEETKAKRVHSTYVSEPKALGTVFQALDL